MSALVSAPRKALAAPPVHVQPLPFLLGYVRRRRLRFAALLGVVVSAATCAVAVQVGMKLIVDAMAADDGAAIWRWVSVFILLIATESVLWRVGGWLGCHAIVDTGVDIRLDLFRHLSGQAMQFFTEHFSGTLGSRVTTTAGATGAVLGTVTWGIVPPCVDFLGAVLVLGAIDVRMALALVTFVALIAAIVVGVGLRGRALHERYAEEGARVSGELVDVVANVWTVKAFSARQREHRRLQEAFGVEADAQRRSWMYLEKVRVLHDLCLWLMAGSMLVFVIRAWHGGTATPGDVVVVSALTFRILHGSRDLALAFVNAAQQMGVLKEALDVLAKPHQVSDPPDATELLGRKVGAIRLSGVSFRYGKGPRVLHDLDLFVPAGQRIGVVGPSGAGKSTLIGLVQRLDDVDAGQITIDGQPISVIAQDALRAQIAVVPQDVALFHRSVMENIRYGDPQATDEEVHAAARAADCDAFVRALPQGYATVVGERGARLSGGQRQRIGIARAFLKNAPILILDEATSALDSRSEAEIQVALGRLMEGRTVIAVAHRLSTLSTFDRVVVLRDGRIVEDGPPEELRRRGGFFAEMWRMQAEGFDLAEVAREEEVRREIEVGRELQIARAS